MQDADAHLRESIEDRQRLIEQQQVAEEDLQNMQEKMRKQATKNRWPLRSSTGSTHLQQARRRVNRFKSFQKDILKQLRAYNQSRGAGCCHGCMRVGVNAAGHAYTNFSLRFPSSIIVPFENGKRKIKSTPTLRRSKPIS